MAWSVNNSRSTCSRMYQQQTSNPYLTPWTLVSRAFQIYFCKYHLWSVTAAIFWAAHKLGDFFLNSQLCYASLWNLSIVRGILNMRLHDLNMEKCGRKGRNNRRHGFSTLFCTSCWPHLGYFSQNISIYYVFVPLSRKSASKTASCSGPITYNKQAHICPSLHLFPSSPADMWVHLKSLM